LCQCGALIHHNVTQRRSDISVTVNQIMNKLELYIHLGADAQCTDRISSNSPYTVQQRKRSIFLRCIYHIEVQFSAWHVSFGQHFP